jgi:hypothetical protein
LIELLVRIYEEGWWADGNDRLEARELAPPVHALADFALSFLTKLA